MFHAKLIVRSWDGLHTRQIAAELGCHPQTVRERLHAFTDRGLDGLGMKPGSGRRPRLTQLERSTILGLVTLPLPPGTPTDELTGELMAPDPEAEAEWTLEALTAAAYERGIQVARSQVRRIFRKAFAGQSLADQHDSAYVTCTATAQLNRHAQPWVWSHPPPLPRYLRRCFVYRLRGTTH